MVIGQPMIRVKRRNITWRLCRPPENCVEDLLGGRGREGALGSVLKGVFSPPKLPCVLTVFPALFPGQYIFPYHLPPPSTPAFRFSQN